MVLLALPGWELEGLWKVLEVLRRAQAGEPECEELLEVVRFLGQTLLDRTVESCVADLERVVAVLSLEIPAVTALATTLVLGSPRDAAVSAAYEAVRAGWEAVRHPVLSAPGAG